MNECFSLRSFYFPVWFSVLATIGSIIFLIFYFQFMVAFGLLIVNIILWTTRYFTTIDLRKKLLEDYLSVAWIEFNNEKIHFDSLDRIFITKEKISHAYRSRSVHRDVSWIEYTAKVLFENGKSAELLTETDKDVLLSKLKPLANFCRIKIENRTSDDWYWIDLEKV